MKVSKCVAAVVTAAGLTVGCTSAGANRSAPIRQGSAAPSDASSLAPKEEVAPVNTLKWTTASEVDNFGFDIYRGLSEEGPFERITSEPLPGAGTTDEPQDYVYVDAEIDPTLDYYYYIESISLGGIRERFSPVIRSPAKRPGASKR